MSMLLETVPNFSTGRDTAALPALAVAMQAVPEAWVLDTTQDPDHNRAVITAVATNAAALGESAFAGVRAAVELLDIRRHEGVHPRVGVADVVPLVPIAGMSLDELALVATQLGQRIAAELQVPVYLYEACATCAERRALSYIRNRGWEFLQTVIATDPLWAPDFGPLALHPTAGACVVGARDFLIAFNLNLDASDLALAQRIAGRIRATAPGGLPAVRALGFPVPAQGCVQVSVNLLDFRVTTLEKIYEWVERLATMAGTKIRDTELVGLIPRAATEGFDMARLHIRDWAPDRILENRLTAVLGPAQVVP